MATRTLTFTGMKSSADPTAISVDFDGVEIFSGAISNSEVGTLFTHDITVNDIPAANVPNPLTNDAIPVLTSTHTVSVECISGATIIVNVTSPPLNVADEIPVIPDPANFGFPTPNYPAQNDDPKYEVTLNGVPVIIQRQQGSQGAWHYEVPAGGILQFKVMIHNLIT